MPDASRETPDSSPASAHPGGGPAGRSPLVRFARRLPLCLLIGYVMWLIGACSLQEKLIYPRGFAGPPLPESVVPREVERVWIDGEGGARVEAWFIPAPGASAQ